MSTGLLASRYQVLGTLGEGAMGRVCRVVDMHTGRQLAMKVLTLPDGGPGERQAALLRFKQEFRLMTQVRHPHCCAVHEFGVLPDGRPYFTMELVEGRGLDEVLPLDAARTREVLAQVLLALDAVHQLGYVHRDLKAANVRLAPDGSVKLMDFGLMEVAGQGSPIAGTLAYVAPEVVKRGPVDRRTDLYALGALGYELVAGRPPFVGERPVDVLRAHVHEVPVPLSLLAPDVDPALELVIRRLLEKDPIDRFQGAFQVLDALGHAIPVGYGGTLLASPMVGRGPELEQLEEKLARVASGLPAGTAAIHGPSGMGKSRLVEELRFLAQLEGVPLAGAASLEDETPYAAIGALLRALWPVLLETVPAACEAQAPALARLLPELVAALGAAPAPELDAAGEKRRLHMAVGELLAALAAEKGLVLVLDDWHWTEPLARELVEHLTRHLADRPALVVLASRYPPEGNPDWVATVRQIPLGPLGAEGTHRMVATMLGAPDVEPAFVRRVAELTEGVPVVVEGLLEHLVASGALAMHGGRWQTAIALGPELMPRRLQGLLVARLAELPAAAGAVARVLAVMGREADLALLQRAAGLADEDLFAALEDLVRLQILDRPDGGRYRFAQDPFAEYLYAHLAGEELAATHQAVGEALEAEAGAAGGGLPRLVALAHHFQRAGDGARTARYALEAGLGQLELQALAPAERLLKAGLAALRALPADPPAPAGGTDPRAALRLQYLTGLARARRDLGATHGAREALTEALALAEALGEARVRAETLAELAHVHRLLANWDEALQTGALALEAAADPAARAGVLLTLSRTHLFRHAPAEAIARGEEALAAARVVGEPRLLSEALAHLGNLLLTYDAARAQAGLAFLQDALALLPALGDMGGLRNAYLLLGNAHQALGEYAAAKEAFAQAFAISEAIGAEGGAVAALANMALANLATGDFEEAVRRAQGAYDRALRTQNTYVLGVSMVVEAIAAAQLGRPTEARPLLRRALEMGRDLKHRFLEILALQGALEVELLLGDLAAAGEAATRLAALIGEDPGTEPVVRLAAAEAEIAARAGRFGEARERLDRAEAAGPAALGRLRLLKARARLALLAEDWAGLERPAREALGLAVALGARALAAELHGMLGELALATGSGAAGAHFKAMLEGAEAMGAPLPRAQALFGLAAARPYEPEARGYAERAQALIEALGQALPEAGRSAFFGYAERARVREGNAIAFSLPRTVGRGTGPLIGLNRESW